VEKYGQRKNEISWNFRVYCGGHSIAPKTTSANAANAKVRYRQMIGRRLFSFCGCGLALAALAIMLFGAYDSYPSRVFGGSKVLA